MTLADAIRKHLLFEKYIACGDSERRKTLLFGIAADLVYSAEARSANHNLRSLKQAIRDAAKNDSGRKPGRPKKSTLRAECEKLVEQWGSHKHARQLEDVLGRVVK